MCYIFVQRFVDALEIDRVNEMRRYAYILFNFYSVYTCVCNGSLSRARVEIDVDLFSLSLSQRENLSCTIEHDDEFFAVGWFYLIKKKRKKAARKKWC